MQNSKISQMVKKLTSKLTYRQSVLLAALCCALVAALIIFFPAGGGEKPVAQKPEAQQPVVEKTKVVKAAIDIPGRTFIKEEMLKVEEVEKDAVPDGAVTELNALIGKPTSTNILKGEVITEKKYYKDMKMLGFSGLIPADCRAMTVPISDVTAVAGFLNPGDYVDVMLVSSGDGGSPRGKILLQNVLLLAINRNGNKPDPNAPQPPPQNDNEKKEGDQQQQAQNQNTVNASPEAMAMATLALTPQEALELAAEAQNGTVYLAMRPFKPSDMFVTDTEYQEAGAIAAEAQESKDATYENAMNELVGEYKATMGEYRTALQQAVRNMNNSGASSAPVYTPPPTMPAPVQEAEEPQSVEVIRGVEKTTVGVR